MVMPEPAGTVARITAATRSVEIDITAANQTLSAPPKGLQINLATEGTAGTLTVVLWQNADDSDTLTMLIPASGIYQICPRQIHTGATGIGSVYALY